MITAAIGDVSYLRWFSLACFFKVVEKLCKVPIVPCKKEGFNKLKIKIESGNESKLKKIRKFPFMLSQRESNAEQIEEVPVPV